MGCHAFVTSFLRSACKCVCTSLPPRKKGCAVDWRHGRRCQYRSDGTWVACDQVLTCRRLRTLSCLRSTRLPPASRRFFEKQAQQGRPLSLRSEKEQQGFSLPTFRSPPRCLAFFDGGCVPDRRVDCEGATRVVNVSYHSELTSKSRQSGVAVLSLFTQYLCALHGVVMKGAVGCRICEREHRKPSRTPSYHVEVGCDGSAKRYPSSGSCSAIQIHTFTRPTLEKPSCGEEKSPTQTMVSTWLTRLHAVCLPSPHAPHISPSFVDLSSRSVLHSNIRHLGSQSIHRLWPFH